MLKIRLKRIGRRNDPSFRVVLVESQRGPKTGSVNENLGFYNPQNDVRELKAERIKYWMKNGAQTSDTVHNMLIDEGIIEGQKINVLPRKSPVQKKSEEKTSKEDGEKSSDKESEEQETPTPSEEKSSPEEESSEDESSEDKGSNKEEMSSMSPEDKSESQPESVGKEKSPDSKPDSEEEKDDSPPDSEASTSKEEA